MTRAIPPSAARAAGASAPEPASRLRPSDSIPIAFCTCGKCLECDAAGYHLDEAITSLGPRLRDRRKAMKLTLDQLAERSGMSKSYIWEIENGKNKNPTIRTALTLSRALGWTLSECIGLYEHGSLLHPEAMRIATEIDFLLRPKTAEVEYNPDYVSDSPRTDRLGRPLRTIAQARGQ